MKLSGKITMIAAVALATFAPMQLAAQGHHPRYLHARADLRRSVRLMRLPDEPNVMRDMQEASGMVERAIHELDLAAMFDRKDLDDNPPVDTHLGRGGRFREILRLLASARGDIEQEEDNPRAREWRNRAFGYIDGAIAKVRQGGYDKFNDTMAMPERMAPPSIHPRYLRALSDLRYARALLWRGDFREVMHDQRAAIEEIDHAIAEAKRAAIDDGKNIDDHPPVDTHMGWEGRFRKSMELLDHALGDLSFTETNMAAMPWRDAARANVERARHLVEKAMRDSWWR
jgi:tetratricopeptide (TPR) repeat protein